MQIIKILNVATKSATRLVTLFILLACSGCGIRTPTIQEPGAGANDYTIAVNSVVGQISCEVGQALRVLYYSDFGKNQHKLTFLKTWGAQFTFLLTVDEKSALNPGLALVTPLQTATTTFAGGATVASMQSFMFGFGGTASTEATRIDTQQRFYPLTDFLLKRPRYDNGRTDRSCLSKVGETGLLFVQSDTGFRDDLRAFVAPLYSLTADQPAKGQPGTVVGMSHNLKFEIVTSGNVTPTWKLVRVSTTSNPLFSVSRDRQQQVIITLGPIQSTPGTNQKSLAPAAQNSQNVQELAAAIRSLNNPNY